MLPIRLRSDRRRDRALFILVGSSFALALACSDSAAPSIHGAGSGVVGPASDIQVAPASAALNQGGRTLLRCAAFDSRGVMLSNPPVWTSSDPSVVSVNGDGAVTAQHAGGAMVSCQIGSRTASAPVTVSTAHIAFVEVSPGAGTLTSGGSIQLIGVPRDSFGLQVPGSDVQWSSADTTIATVSAGGVVTAKATGDADIRAVSGGVVGMNKIKVSPTPPPPVASITVSVDQTSLSLGQMAHANATTMDANGQVVTGRSITWSASNPSVITAMTSNPTKANVRALARGASALVATSEGKTASVNITVGAPAVASISTSLASASIVVGHTTLASAVPLDGLGNPMSGTVTWNSLDPSIASVSSSGVVTGVAPGSVIIRASAGGVTGDASLTVTTAPVASVKTTLAAGSLNIGQTTQATAVSYDAGGSVLSGRYVAWTSLNPAVATVSISGMVTAVAAGSAVIRATVESKTSDATLVVNSPAPPTPPAPAPTASVVVGIDSASLAVGHTAHANAVAKDANNNLVSLTGKTILWVSQNPSIASVTSTGVVTGVSAGSTRIQATIDGIVGSAPLTVSVPSVINPPAPTSGPSPGHPNEPSGYTSIAADPFDTLDAGAFAPGWNRSNVSIATDPSSPEGSTNVGQMLFPQGMSYGIAPGGIYPRANPFPSKPRSVYVSFWVKVSSNWRVPDQSGNNKILYMIAGGELKGSIEFLGFGFDINQLQPAPVLENIGGVTGAGGGALPINSVPYDATSAAQRGVWGHYEVLMTLNTPGQSDGTYKWWWNGKLYGDYSGRVRWTDTQGAAWENVYWEPTYGGLSSPVPANQYMWLKNLYVSGK